MLGQFVRNRRKYELGLTVKEAAEQWGLTASAIYMIERGDRSDLRSETLRKLASGLDLTVDALLAHGQAEPATT